MAHRTLINGTGYDISGGREMIGGTGYAKKGGRTLIDGTVYEIGFAKKFTVTITGEFYATQYGAKGYVKIAGTSVPVGEYQVESGTEIEVRAGYDFSGRYNAAIYLNGNLISSGQNNKYTFNATNDTKINFIAGTKSDAVYITTE